MATSRCQLVANDSLVVSGSIASSQQLYWLRKAAFEVDQSLPIVA